MYKRRIAFFLMILLFLPCPARALGEETVYLRVIARDNSWQAFQEKMRVRNEILRQCPRQITGGEGFFSPLLPPDCKAAWRVWSPGGSSAPKLTYYVTIGAGKGRNWWGVLYQDSLLLARTDDDEAADSPDQITFVWPLWQWIKEALGIGAHEKTGKNMPPDRDRGRDEKVTKKIQTVNLPYCFLY